MQRVASPLWLKALDHLFLMRPMLMPPLWTISILGYGQGQRQDVSPDWTTLLYPIAVFTLLTGGVYVQNQVFDLEGDRANNKLFLLGDGYISLRAAGLQTWGCYLGAVILAFFHSTWFGALMCGALLLGSQYNAPPLRMKDRPVEGLLYNVVIYGGFAFVTGWMVLADFSLDLLLKTIPYCLGVGAIYLNTTLPDIPGDRAAGKITIAVKYGYDTAATLAGVMLAVAVITGWIVDDLYIAIPSLLALPLFVKMRVTRNVEDVALATKMGVLLLALAAVLTYPPYLALLILLFFGSKPYYRYRFGITYPSFRVQR
ncbi:MAG: UbiA family prenyltransferase [Candidatus Latescibacteria bacterium]|nr:UbiA family prenyltransferase [Candidatus Latescibacterota bacterium]